MTQATSAVPVGASETVLEVEGLETVIDTPRGAVRAVDGVSFEVRHGETLALLGESGCGKSMTALSVMRLLPPGGRIAAGRVALAGKELLSLPERSMRSVRGRRVAMIFQEPSTSLNPVLDVGTQVGEVLAHHHGLSGGRLRERTVELLGAVGIPAPASRIDAFPHQLSGGMKQRVMIAVALAGEPELLIADEPTTALDVTIQAQVLSLLREIQGRTRMGILLITHDLGVVAETADSVAVMYAGHVVEQAPVGMLFDAPAHPYTRKLFASLPDGDKRAGTLDVIPGSVPSLSEVFAGCRFAARCDRALERCRSEVPRWWEAGAGQQVRCHLFDPAHGPGGDAPVAARAVHGPAPPGRLEAAPALLRVDDLQVHFPIHRGVLKRTVGHVRAVDGISLEVAAGRTLALVGESGCGKTTAGKAVLQLIRPTAGRVRFGELELQRLPARRMREARRAIQIVFQDPFASMNPRMRVGEIIAEGLVALGIERDRAARQRRVDELLAHVGLDADAKSRFPHEFSGGQRQRICIARALAVEPRLIVCDEPTSALDVSVQAQILNLLKRLQAELGLAYVFITHDISVVAYMAHEVAVMYLGRIVERGTVEEVLDDPMHPYTRALLSAVPVTEPGSQRDVIRLEGELPSPLDPPAGCHFHPRCPEAMDVCRERYPAATPLSGSRIVHCHLMKG